MEAAFAMAREGDAVLLSPACASFDMFRQLQAARRGLLGRRARHRTASGGLMLYNPARRDTAIDQGLVWSAVLLASFGLVMVYSASIAMADAERFTGFRSHYFLARHSVYLAAGVLAGAMAFKVPVRFWQAAAPWLFMGGVAFLVAVLIPGLGREVNGARRWIPLGPASFQPSEIMKLLVVLYAADYTVRKAAFMDDLRKGFLPMFSVMFFVAGLLLREPDFGALVVVTTIAMTILFLGGLNWRIFVALAAAPRGRVRAAHRLLALPAAAHPRVHGPVGRRLRQGLPALALPHRLRPRRVVRAWAWAPRVEKLFYLPEAHTDFLLAVIAEELGFAGVAAVIALFLFLVTRAFAVGRQAASLERYFAALVAQGIGVWLAVAGVHQHGREHGPAADQGPHAAVPLLRRHRHRRQLRRLAILLRIDCENRYLMRGGSL